jgi:hypothetical protein
MGGKLSHLSLKEVQILCQRAYQPVAYKTKVFHLGERPSKLMINKKLFDKAFMKCIIHFAGNEIIASCI